MAFYSSQSIQEARVTTTETLEENINQCSEFLKKGAISYHFGHHYLHPFAQCYTKIFGRFNKSFGPGAKEDNSNRILHSVTTGCIQNLGNNTQSLLMRFFVCLFVISLKVVSLNQKKGVVWTQWHNDSFNMRHL